MTRIEERIAQLKSARDSLQVQIELLTSTKNGDVAEFLKQAEAAGLLPSATHSDTAFIIDLWEKYKAAGEIPETRSIIGASLLTSGESK